jgi:hypothetical protein
MGMGSVDLCGEEQIAKRKSCDRHHIAAARDTVPWPSMGDRRPETAEHGAMNATFTSTDRLAPQQLVGGAIYATLFAGPMGRGFFSLTKLIGMHSIAETRFSLLATISIAWVVVFAIFLSKGAWMNLPGRFGRTLRILEDSTASSSVKIRATLTDWFVLAWLICTIITLLGLILSGR